MNRINMTTTEERLIVYSNGLCCCSVCASIDDPAEVEAEVNRVHPSGVTPWRIATRAFLDGTPNPSVCNTTLGRRHWLLEC
jgi:hypothetical protein